MTANDIIILRRHVSQFVYFTKIMHDINKKVKVFKINLCNCIAKGCNLLIASIISFTVTSYKGYSSDVIFAILTRK